MIFATPVSQELFTVGYYIFTVDGPRITVAFYSSSHGADYGDVDLMRPPEPLTFYHRERFGYTPASAYATQSPILHLDRGLWVGGNFWDGRATP